MVLDDQPAVPVLREILLLEHGDEDLPELLAHLHDEGDAAVEGVLLDLVDDGDCCQLPHVGGVELPLVVLDVGQAEGLAVLPTHSSYLVVQVHYDLLVVALPGLGTVVEGRVVIHHHLPRPDGYFPAPDQLQAQDFGEVVGRVFAEELREANESREFKDGVIAENVLVLLAVIDGLTCHDLEPHSVSLDLPLLHLLSQVDHLLQHQQILPRSNLLGYLVQALVIV